MQNLSKRKKRARNKKTVVEKVAGFSIRTKGAGFIVQIRREGMRETKTFSTLEAARLHCSQLDAKRTNEGLAAFALNPVQREDASRALEKLKGRASLQAAVEAWLRLNPESGAVTFSGLIEQHLAELEALNRRPDTILERKYRLERFATDYGTHAATAILPKDIEQWLTLRVKPKTFNAFRRSLSAAFAFALKKGFVPVNPVSAVSLKTTERTDPHFWPVASVAAIMKAAADLDARNAARNAAEAARRAAKGREPMTPPPPLLPVLALSAFAGLRPKEAERLAWGSVNLDEALIRISPTVSKTRHARLVPMPDNLVRWLLPYRKASGPVAPSPATIKRARKTLLSKAGLPAKWPVDVLRHCFATYHMAVHAHEGRLAEIMGNSPRVIQNHYKGLATAKEGAKYFQIMPPAAGNVIQLRSAAA